MQEFTTTDKASLLTATAHWIANASLGEASYTLSIVEHSLVSQSTDLKMILYDDICNLLDDNKYTYQRKSCLKHVPESKNDQ